MTIKRIIDPIKEIPDIIDIIFNNFSHLKYIDEAQHNHKNIKNLLSNKINENYCYISLDDDLTTINGYLLGEKKILMDGRMVFYITYIYVSPDDRNMGIGTNLINKVILKCKKSFGIKFVMLVCDKNNNNANNFYAKLGFVMDPVIKIKNMNVLLLFM